MFWGHAFPLPTPIACRLFIYRLPIFHFQQRCKRRFLVVLWHKKCRRAYEIARRARRRSIGEPTKKRNDV